MNMIDRLDPELAAPLQGFLAAVGGGLNLHDLPATRTMMAQMWGQLKGRLPPVEGVASADRLVPGRGGASDVAVRIYQPINRSAILPALLWTHGGGYVLGSMEQDDLRAKRLVTAAECVVVSVDYRLAPEHPFPAPIEDCYAALKWLAAQAEELGVDKTRIAVGGTSAGGGLAAGLALLARDRAEVDVAFQLLIYAMLDDRTSAAADTPPAPLPWTPEQNLIGWRSYLGHDPGGEDVSPYAAAARATNLMGLPPAYIAVGELDLFLYENIAYAQRLLHAGVSTELHVYRGAYHGFDGLASTADVAQRCSADRDHALKRSLHPIKP